MKKHSGQSKFLETSIYCDFRFEVPSTTPFVPTHRSERGVAGRFGEAPQQAVMEQFERYAVCAMCTVPSSQQFCFSIDGQVAFRGRLQSHRCPATTSAGPQCLNRSVFGAPYCWRHLLATKHLRIKPSDLGKGYGKGLFAEDRPKTPNAIVFRKNLTIISYEGQLLTQTELEDRYKDHTAPYAVIQKRGGVHRCGTSTRRRSSCQPPKQ